MMMAGYMNAPYQNRNGAAHGANGDYSFLGVAFALYFFSTGFDFLSIVPGVSISRIVALLLIVICILNSKKMQFEISGTGLSLFFLMGLGLIPLLGMSAPQQALNSMLSFELGVAIAFLGLSFPFTNADIRLCERALLFASFVLCILMFVSPGNVGTQWISERVVVSIGGSQQDANEFCGYMIYAIAFLTYCAIMRRKPWFFLLVGIMMYCIMMTGSRGGLIANFAALLVALGTALRRTGRKMRWLIFAAILCVLVLGNIDLVLSMLPASVADRFTGASLSSGTGLERTKAWGDVIVAFLSSDIMRQLFGHGYEATASVTFNGLVAHNSFIEVLYTFGILGFTAYMACVLLPAFRSWRAHRFIEVFAIIGFGVLLCSLSAYAFKPFWAIVTFTLMNTTHRTINEHPEIVL